MNPRRFYALLGLVFCMALTCAGIEDWLGWGAAFTAVGLVVGCLVAWEAFESRWWS